MNKEVLMGFIRHALTLGAGVLITKGYADDATAQQLVGAFMVVIGFVGSWLNKKAADAKLEAEKKLVKK